MKTNKEPSDPLDALLSEQPIVPKADFTERALARMRLEGEADAALDDLLAQQPIRPGAEFTDRTLTAIEAEHAGKIVGLPAWAVLLGGMAATLVAGVIAFVAMFQHGWEVGPRPQAQAGLGREAPEPVVQVAAADAHVALPAAPVSVAAMQPLEVVSMASTADEQSAWEELLLMEATLSAAADITEQDNWQALALLTN